MRDFKGSQHQAGYNQEEAWFHKRNQELIEKMKKRKHLKLVASDGQKVEDPPSAQEEDQERREAA